MKPDIPAFIETGAQVIVKTGGRNDPGERFEIISFDLRRQAFDAQQRLYVALKTLDEKEVRYTGMFFDEADIRPVPPTVAAAFRKEMNARFRHKRPEA